MLSCSEPALLRRVAVIACMVMFTIGPVHIAPAANDTSTVQEEPIDATAFFQSLVDRYQNLVRYVEETRVEEVTVDFAVDSKPIRTSTQVRVEIENGRLKVERPGLLDDAIKTVTAQSDPASEADLWLLPHMSLRFADNPLMDFRRGVDEGFVPAEANVVNVDNRQMVRVELRSVKNESADIEAKFELFVDPERMLVERIKGEQQLPGGLMYRTDLDIDPIHAYGSDPDMPLDEKDGAKPVDAQIPIPAG